MNQILEKKHKLMTGFDPMNAVKIEDRKVSRKIFGAEKESFNKLKADLHDLIKEESLVRFTVKKNTICSERLPIIYPYEWPQTAFFEALKFHCNLCAKVLPFGWYVKDFLLSNVLFDKTKPVFVDLGSFKKIRHINTLKANITDTFNSMMFPYALLPALAFSIGKKEIARTWLSTRFCNTKSKPPSLRELFYDQKWMKLQIYKGFHLCLKKSVKWFPNTFLFCILYKILNKITFKSKPSAYTSYYEKKGKGVSEKDAAVITCLKKLRPTSVIDLGANTGKYSLLAANTAKVVYAIEEDESCADVIFQRAKKTKARIVTIVKKFENFDKPVFANGSLYGLKKNPFLFFPLTERIQSELVLCLGLIHHLCLGRGMSFQKINKTLEKICQKFILIEFVDFDDILIQDEISFFPAYHRKIKAYSQANFLKSFKPAFKLIKTFPSDSPTRTLFLFQKK